MSRSLRTIRDEIDELDCALQQFINRRAHLAQEIAEIKRSAGEEPSNYYRPEREADILRGVIARHTGPLSVEMVTHLFRELMSACLALESTLKVGFLGPEGTYTHSAMLHHFGSSVTSHSCMNIDEVFDLVSLGQVDYGVIPFENTREGLISQTFEALVTSTVKICGEVHLQVNHTLLGTSDFEIDGYINLNKIKQVYAHPQSLAQCREWLDQHLPHVERVSSSSNAFAASQVSNRTGAVAIASEKAAHQYGLTVLKRGLTTQTNQTPQNVTRFIVIGKTYPPTSTRDKTVILIELDQKNDLLSILKPLNNLNIQVSNILTRTSHRTLGSALLLIELVGHVNEEPLSKALAQLKQRSSYLQVLGTYPTPELIFES